MGNTRKKRIEVDMCSGRMLPQMLRFAGPLILSSVLQLLFNAADVIVVGQFGSEHSLAAVGSTGTLVALVTNLIVGLAMGATVMASQHVGAKNDERVHATVHSSIAFSLLIGAVLSVVCLALNEQSLTWMLTPAEVKPLSAQYLYIYYSGLIFVALYNFGAALLRAKGDTRRPLTYLIIAGVLNVFLNLFFVIVFKMDVAGVALATIISQALSAVLVLRCLMREEGAFRLEWRKLRLHKGDTARLLRIGVPAGLQQVIFNISNLVIQSAINSFGPVVMAGSAGSVNIENLIGASTSSLAQTGMTFISANLGAGKFDRVDKAYRLSLFSSILAGVVLGGLAALLRYPLMHIYSTVPAEINAGAGPHDHHLQHHGHLCGDGHGIGQHPRPGVFYHAGHHHAHWGLRLPAGVDRHPVPDAGVPHARLAVYFLPHFLDDHFGRAAHLLRHAAPALPPRAAKKHPLEPRQRPRRLDRALRPTKKTPAN